MRRYLAVLSLAMLFTSTGAFAFTSPPFPRIGVNWIADQNYQDPSIQQQLAHGNIALISVWPGWANGRGTTVAQVIQNLKAINPNLLVFNYVMQAEISQNSAANTPFAPVYAKLAAMNWYLYPSGTSGSPVPSTFPGAVIINNTLFSPPDSNGNHWSDWIAQWFVSQYPGFDGFNTDEVFWDPEVNGDWNRDGTTDYPSNPTVGTWYRQGYAHYFSVLNQLMPGKFQVGNIATWGAPSSVLTEYQGMLNGGVMEGMIGYSWSVETWAGWQTMMAYYRKTMAALAAPQLGMFAQVGSVTDYQSMRYGLTSTMMDNGYYIFNSSSAGNDAPWFDEFGAALGNSISTPPTTAWQNGVYRRDFQNGVALVNPKGNGPQTVTLETTYKRLSGTQVPSINSGQTVQTLTLNDRDGIILLRIAAPPPAPTVPQPPASITVH
jgi:Hypothetical glycosyl hydrolase family 15